MDYWRDKRAVVIGASAGLGRVLAGVLVKHKARVAIVARGQAALDAVGEELRTQGSDVLPIVADVTKPADVDRLAATVIQRWRGVDFVCHCAGRSTRGNALDTSAEEFRALWEVNFLSAVRCMQAFRQPLVDSRGHIVLVGSLASKTAPRYLGAYPASKFAVAAFAQQLRLELSEHGVHVLLVCPAPIARKDAGNRYAEHASDLPPRARLPGGGAKVSAVDPQWLARRILRACERGSAELIVPSRARLLFAISQLSPRLGDWLLRKMSSG